MMARNHMRPDRLIPVLLVLVPLVLGIVGYSFFTNTAVHTAPNVRIRKGLSENWSGYAAESNIASPTNGFVTKVVGGWMVPTLTCSTSQNTYLATWVGIDGYSDGTVEQTGTEQDCVNGVQQNYAWVEFYPKPSQTVSTIAVSAGDSLTASVTYQGGNLYMVSITDTSTGQSFQNTYKANAQRQSAEWIAEAPSSGGILQLANFGTMGFNSAQYTDNTGSTYAIDSLGSSTYDAITMNDPSGGISTPSSLTDSGNTSSFTVTYSSGSTTTTTTTASSTASGSLSVAVSTDKSSYTQNSWAYITVTVTANNTPVAGASVTITVTSPSGGTSQGSGSTNSNGQVVFKYRIGPNAPIGTYTATAQASASGYNSGSGSTTFTIT